MGRRFRKSAGGPSGTRAGQNRGKGRGTVTEAATSRARLPGAMGESECEGTFGGAASGLVARAPSGRDRRLNPRGGHRSKACDHVRTPSSGSVAAGAPGGVTGGLMPSATAILCDSPRLQGRVPVSTDWTRLIEKPRSRAQSLMLVPDASNRRRAASARLLSSSGGETRTADICNVPFCCNRRQGFPINGE
jgi:hypothetical protein